MTGNKWIPINTTNVHRNTSEMILLLENSSVMTILYWLWVKFTMHIYSHMDIVKIRVPWRDDLMNVKILFSCWPKYLYTHIWPQNIEKWGKTVILLVKWWISNFRPPSGEPYFRCLRHRGFAKLLKMSKFPQVFHKSKKLQVSEYTLFCSTQSIRDPRKQYQLPISG